MKTPRYNEPQILAILRQAESGVPVSELCREHGMSNASFHKWRSKYGGMDATMINQMRALEDENRRLKKMYAEISIQAELLKEALGKSDPPALCRVWPRKMWRGMVSALRWPAVHRKVRHEGLDQHIIETIEEVQNFATQWLWTYDNDRPNRAIGGITPAQKLKMAA